MANPTTIVSTWSPGSVRSLAGAQVRTGARAVWSPGSVESLDGAVESTRNGFVEILPSGGGSSDVVRRSIGLLYPEEVGDCDSGVVGLLHPAEVG